MASNQKPTEAKPPAQVDADDDLDELDDVLGKFTDASSSQQAPQKLGVPSVGRPRTNTRVDTPPVSTPGKGTEPTTDLPEDALTAEFAQELAKGMESLMRELGGEPAAAAASGPREGETQDEAAKRALSAAWEAMLVEGLAGRGDGVESEELGEDGVKDKKPSADSGDFQSKIKETMDRLRQTESNLKTNADSQGSAPNFGDMESILGALKDLGLNEGGDGEGEQELTSLLETMMDSIMSKEVLHEPLKELTEKFPPYLANPPEPIAADDRKRYEAQLECARKIVAVFEDPKYDEKNQETASKVMGLMSDMQSHGTPPEAVMGPMPAGLGNEGCSIM